MELCIKSNSQSHIERFRALSLILASHQEHWQGRAFVQPNLSWQSEHVELSTRLLTLSDEELEALESTPSLVIQLLGEFFPELLSLPQLLVFPALNKQRLAEPGRFFNRHIPGRKWQQIQSFAAYVPYRGDHIVDWCSGKGHLARYYGGIHKCSAHCLERESALLESGRALSTGLALEFHECDVLQSSAADHLNEGSHVLGLHACGDLHRRLLALVVEKKTKALSLAPCCYQKTQAVQYTRLSAAASEATFTLKRQDLHSAVQETVTAGRAVRERRQKLQAWRLGFDLWQRQWRGSDDYLATPSLPQSVLKLGFEGFCRLLAGKVGLEIGSDDVDWQAYELAGVKRFAQARRLDLFRLGFRRAIEVWLLLDQALFLQEQGYTVELGEFCERRLSPRNLLINAWR